MKLEPINYYRNDERGCILECDKVNYLSRYSGIISADHAHEDEEICYLVKGEIELTIGDETEQVKAPTKFYVPPNVYHKIVGITDYELIYDRINKGK
jgi:mannose-6-phosphate isomerase-like protein (cupin superfamily)